jgi:transcriptional regulator GlxA family with amidase domain
MLVEGHELDGPGWERWQGWRGDESSSRLPLRELPIWILEHLHLSLDVETLAAREAMSPRHFSRTFANDLGTTPAQFVERLKVDTARRLLAESDNSLDEIAGRVGFGSIDTMNRSFRRQTGELASQVRKRRDA